MYNSILVPLDGSKRAEAILPHVENLAQRYNAEATFLQVVEPALVVVGPEAAYTALHEHELAERTKQAEAYLAARQGVSARRASRPGSASSMGLSWKQS